MEITQMTTNPMMRFFPGGAQPVDASHLEYLGKQAAILADAGNMSLSDAVVRTLCHEKLGSEQVVRVVEFANTEAFSRKFSALAAPDRVVDIEGGPADPQRVLQTLNDQARPQSVEIQSLDYSMPPETKVAEVDFGLGPVPAPRTFEGVIQDVLNLRSKVSAAQEETVQMAESARFQMITALKSLQGVVKTAGLDGLHREDLVAAWLPVSSELTPTALEHMPQLPSRGNTKVASRVNPDHPVMSHFREFAKFSNRFATCTAARQNLERRLVEIETFLSEHTQ